MSAARTLLDKIWDEHVVHAGADGADLLYVDLHLLHEVTSPQAFAGLSSRGRTVRRPDLHLATVDHAIPTAGRARPWADPLAREQVALLGRNCRRFGIQLLDENDPDQGIVHVIAPERGLSRPGMIIVCGDSHTSTHGAFGALAFGIGTSEVEHVLATQTLPRVRPKIRRVRTHGTLPDSASAKDLTLAVLAAVGTNGGAGAVFEFTGAAVGALSMEGRMTLCNMAIEGGARAGLVAPDETTFAYLRERASFPGEDAFVAACDRWRTFESDPGAAYDRTFEIDVSGLGPRWTWGTTPAQNLSLAERVPEPRDELDAAALEYMGLHPGDHPGDLRVDRVFIGSCTNARIEDLRAAARVLSGRKVAPHVQAMVVPGSGRVRRQAEAEGLGRVFRDAGVSWREPGCSMCLGMNPDRLRAQERCASTSNRNFRGRQGPGGRTHLLSPAAAAAAAVAGTLVDPQEISP